MRLRMLGSTDTYFQSVLDAKPHRRMRGRVSFAAVLQSVHRRPADQPLPDTRPAGCPSHLLMRLMDIDEMLTSWRYRHAQMVMRMLGKEGTGAHGYDSYTPPL